LQPALKSNALGF